MEFLQKLDSYQIWALIFTGFIFVFYVIRFLEKMITERGLPNFFGEGYYIPPKKEKETIKSNVWVKKIKNKKGVEIGELGFLKETVVFKIFGNSWNSATVETIEGLSVFESEWIPPSFLTDSQKEEAESYVFIHDCNPLHSRITKKIRENSKKWKHVYVICSRDQYMHGDVDSLNNENGINLNITIIPISTRLSEF